MYLNQLTLPIQCLVHLLSWWWLFSECINAVHRQFQTFVSFLFCFLNFLYQLLFVIQRAKMVNNSYMFIEDLGTCTRIYVSEAVDTFGYSVQTHLCLLLKKNALTLIPAMSGTLKAVSKKHSSHYITNTPAPFGPSTHIRSRSCVFCTGCTPFSAYYSSITLFFLSPRFHFYRVLCFPLISLFYRGDF